MRLFRSIAGQIRLSLTCADPPKALRDLRSFGMDVSDVQYIDDLCLHFSLSRRDLVKITAYAEQKGCGLQTLQRRGIFWSILGLVHRPVLMIGLSVILLLSLFLPGRILFVQVQGNNAVATNRIVEAAANQGICMGASGREVRSEHIKNALLDEIPQLQWLGVNVKGCVAVISVRERQEAEHESDLPPVTSLISKADGIVQSITVTQGTALCKPGDAVAKGQTLISGYSDLGICQLGTRARGEVYALTQREITALSPQNYQMRCADAGKEVKYALLLGNKRINFYKSSGILDASCARIYSVWYMTLPGGFQMPIGIIQEVWQHCETQQVKMTQADLADAAKTYLLQQLTDGQILVSHTDIQEDDSVLRLLGSYVCREMVTQIQIEEN